MQDHLAECSCEPACNSSFDKDALHFGIRNFKACQIALLRDERLHAVKQLPHAHQLEIRPSVTLLLGHCIPVHLELARHTLSCLPDC